MVAVDLQFKGQFPDRPGPDGLHKAGVPPQFQRRQAEELRPRPEPFGPVDGQQLKVRVGHRDEPVLLHQLREQRRKAFQNGAVHRCRQQVFFLFGRIRCRLLGLHRCFQLLGTGRKDHPAVARFRHPKMFQFHGISSSPHKSGHQQHQHHRQRKVQHFGPQHGAVAFHIHLLRIFRVII